MAHHFQISEDGKLCKISKMSICCIYKNKMLLLRALKTKRKKCLRKDSSESAFVSIRISVFLMDFYGSWILLKHQL